MPRITRSRLVKAATLLLITLTIFIAPRFACADEFTGTPGHDAKDLMPYCPPAAPEAPPADAVNFVPMPEWARGVLIPPMPDVLKPMGRRTLIAIAKKPAPNPLEPPKDSASVESTTAGANPKQATPAETPAMIAVSPFLQWVHANPQAAAAMARQQASGYQNPNAPVPAPNTNPTAGTTASNGAPTPANGDQNPYWLPPLIDSSTITTGSPVRGSAAIYSQPQR